MQDKYDYSHFIKERTGAQRINIMANMVQQVAELGFIPTSTFAFLWMGAIGQSLSLTYSSPFPFRLGHDFYVFIQLFMKMAKCDLLIYYLLCQNHCCCTVSGVLCLPWKPALRFLKLAFPSRSSSEWWGQYYWTGEPQYTRLRMATDFSWATSLEGQVDGQWSGCGGREVIENHRFHWFPHFGGGYIVDLLQTQE